MTPKNTDLSTTTNSAPNLAIVVKGWPRLSETFIAQELVALEQAGHRFDIWSLRFPTDKKRHPLHDQLKARVLYLPEYLHNEPMRVARAIRQASKLPGFSRAFAIWRRDLARDRSRNRVRRFGQACVLATEAAPSIQAFYAHFMHTPSSVTRYAAIMLDKPWSFSAHAKDIWTSPEWEKREKLNANTHGATFGATCTAYGAEHLRELADTPNRVDLIYHGLDFARFPNAPNRPLRSPDSPFRMMSVGRLVEKKGFDRVIDALALLDPSLDWHWTHIGGGALKQVMADRARDAGVADRITWCGACDQPEVIAAMRAADLFVLPSRIAADGDRDGLPNVLMEAASQKLAILSTPVAAIPEFIDSGVHGLLSDDAPQSLANAMTDMAQNPATTHDMAEHAHARLFAEFGMSPGIARLSTRLTDMTQGGTSAKIPVATNT
jgi:glycosyltransferase involved in cell wall biosynthesis